MLASDDQISAAGPGPAGRPVVDHLVDAIARGDHPPGSRLPPEDKLSELAAVSRLTVREAIRVLRIKGVVRVEQGRGTFVNPTSRWAPLDPALLAARTASPGDAGDVARKLTEARRMVEIGAAELAAERRSIADLRALVTRDGRHVRRDAGRRRRVRRGRRRVPRRADQRRRQLVRPVRAPRCSSRWGPCCARFGATRWSPASCASRRSAGTRASSTPARAGPREAAPGGLGTLEGHMGLDLRRARGRVRERGLHLSPQLLDDRPGVR